MFSAMSMSVFDVGDLKSPSVPELTSKTKNIEANIISILFMPKLFPSLNLLFLIEIATPRGSVVNNKKLILYSTHRAREPFHWNRNYDGEHIPVEPPRSWRVTSLMDDHCLRGRRRDLEVSPFIDAM